MSNASNTKKTGLQKELGFFSVYALATGSTLSAGFFLLPGIAATKAGSAVVLAYVVAALPLIPATLSIIELATAMPKAGGSYYFLDRSLGPLAGTIGGIGTWISLVLKTAFALIGMGAYLSLFFPNIQIIPLAVGLAFAFGMLNLAGSKGAGKFQLLLVSGLLMLLLVFLTGIVKVEWSNFQNFSSDVTSDWATLIATSGLVYISYVGVTNVASVSEEIKNPEKTLPYAVLLSMITAIVIYALGTMMMVGVLGDKLTDQSAGKIYYAPAAHTAELAFGHVGKIVITIAAILAFFSVGNAGILSSSRYPLAMSRDNLMPKVFGRISNRGIPFVGVTLTTGIIVLLLLFVPVKEIAKLASAFQLMMFAMLCFAVVAMRESRIDSYDPSFRSPFYPWTQIIGMILPLVFISQMGWSPILFSSSMIALAAVWYFRYGSKRVTREGAIFHVFKRLGERYHAPLDEELRIIMIEKGLRPSDPFDDIVARAPVVELNNGDAFNVAIRSAASEFAKNISDSAEHISEGFQRCSQLGMTAMAHGSAVIHLRTDNVEQPEMVLVRSQDGVSIEHLDDFGDRHAPEESVRAVFFLISPEKNPGQHLRLLAHIAAHVENPDFMSSWLDASNDQKLKESLLRNERYVSVSVKRDDASHVFIDQEILDVELPGGTLVAIVRRGAETFVPRGNTRLLEGDQLTIIGEPEKINRLYEMYHHNHANTLNAVGTRRSLGGS